MIRALRAVAGRFAVCRLPPGQGVPWWSIWSRGLLSVTQSPDETSVVCDESLVPAGIACQRGFSAFVIQGPVPFEETGVLATVIQPLAAAAISVFVLATFDTDYVLVPSVEASRAMDVWRAAGVPVDV